MNELLANYPAVLDVATVAEILGVTPATVSTNRMKYVRHWKPFLLSAYKLHRTTVMRWLNLNNRLKPRITSLTT